MNLVHSPDQFQVTILRSDFYGPSTKTLDLVLMKPLVNVYVIRHHSTIHGFSCCI